jgi:quercetin dioxygenase-like cupin family protein
MPNKGDTLENPVTSERVIFLETSASSGGTLLRMEVFNLANGFNKIVHIHPTQIERHEVLGGEMGVNIGGQERVLRAGESAVFNMNVPHMFWNISGPNLHFITEFRPAFNTEDFIESYIAVAKEGKSNAKGQPPLLLFFVMLREYPIAGYYAKAPIWLQKAAISVLAFIGRLIGYRGVHQYPDA